MSDDIEVGEMIRVGAICSNPPWGVEAEIRLQRLLDLARLLESARRESEQPEEKP